MSKRIFLSGDLVALEHMLRDEGDEIIQEPEEPEGQSVSLPSVERTIPPQLLGVEDQSGEADYFLVRHPGQQTQYTLALPLIGLLSAGQGPKESSGLAMRFVPRTQIQHLFDSLPLLEPILSEWGYRGPLTLAMTGEGKVKYAFTGLPRYGYFNLCEHIRGKISDYFVSDVKERGPLHEAWSISILVTRYPYPFSGEGKLNSQPLGLSREGLKHFFPFDTRRIRGELYSCGPRIGVATAWSTQNVRTRGDSEHDGALGDCIKRALWGCEQVRVDGKMYRTDQYKVVQEKYMRLKRAGLV